MIASLKQSLYTLTQYVQLYVRTFLVKDLHRPVLILDWLCWWCDNFQEVELLAYNRKNEFTND